MRITSVIFLRLHWCVWAVAAVAMLAGASGELSPGLSTALWLPSLLVLACDRSSPLRRAVSRGLQVPLEDPQAMIGGDGVVSSHETSATDRRTA